MNKKGIILIVWCILGVVFSVSSTAQRINVEAGMNLVGYISDGGKGIPNVVVSDGYGVARTDANGVYQMKRNEKAKFVFVSVPSEYKLPVAGSIPVYYKPINQQLQVVYADFQLEKGTEENEFVLVTMADPQPAKDWELARFRNETVKDIQSLVKEYPFSTSFLGLAVGDLTWDAPQLYPGFTDAVNEIPFPVLMVIGNHDHDQKVIDNDYKASHNFEKYFGPANYSYNRGQCHFIVLDDIMYGERKKYENRISEEQLSWLKEDLKYVDKSKLIIVGVHAPTSFNERQIVKNANDLYRILDGYNVILMSGHTHTGTYTEINNTMKEYTVNAVFGSGWSGDIGQAGAPNGYAVFEISGNKLNNQYFKGTGLPKSYQMKLYPHGRWDSQKKNVIANIWNYNHNWDIKVYENDKLQKKGMIRYADYDPDSYDFYFGADKPKHRPKTEPKKAQNLFYYTPKNKKSIVKVVATDEFGNRYEDEIDLKK
jgi:hypothetical protein